MFRRIGPALILVVAATAMVGWHAPAQRVEATDPGELALLDTDGDFLPDSVEWAVMTSASAPDTDNDGVSDFVEVVQHGAPRQAGVPLPQDQEMRVVVTGPQPGSQDTQAWMHVLIRLVNPTDAIVAFHSWIEMSLFPGFQIPLDLTLFPGAQLRERITSEGHWIHLAVPLTSVSFLAMLCPCAIGAESVLANRTVHSTVNMVEVQDTVCAVVPFSDGRYVLQSIAPVVAIGGEGQSNRVCLLELSEVGSGPGGTIYEVVDAYCDDCNEMECGPGCAQSIGWILTLPGGLEGVTSTGK